MAHAPVLLKEVIHYLNPKPGSKIIDATFSGGGHSTAILERIKPQGRILGIELDKELYRKARERFSNIQEIILINGNYRDLKKITEENDFNEADGILFDLGMSSWHLEESKRGFSFRKDEPLDMRFDEKQELTAREIINQWPPETIEKILREYGEERFAKPISRAIVESRKRKPIISTFQLIEAIKDSVPLWYRSGRRVHFATKTFQALRIAVNDELGNLETAIRQLPEVLKKGGRALFISFHSLEDRLVKNAFRELRDKGAAELLVKKPVRPSAEEILENPRSRSAKLRAIMIK